MADISIDFPQAEETVEWTFAVGGLVKTDVTGTVLCKLYYRSVVIEKTDTISATGVGIPWSVTYTVDADFTPSQLVAEFYPSGSGQADATAQVDPIHIEN